MKLAYPIDVFGHYFYYYNMGNDQFINIFFKIDQVVSIFWGFCVKNLYVQANFVI